MSGMGANITAIAALEGMDRSVLLRLHGESLEVGRHQANLNVARAFYKAASSGSDWRASLSWLRHQAGWLEASQPQVVRYDGSKQAANEASRAAGSADWGDLLDGGDNVDSPGEPSAFARAGDAMSMQQTAEALGLSVERVRQIQNSGLAKLHRALARRDLSLADLLGDGRPSIGPGVVRKSHLSE